MHCFTCTRGDHTFQRNNFYENINLQRENHLIIILFTDHAFVLFIIKNPYWRRILREILTVRRSLTIFRVSKVNNNWMKNQHSHVEWTNTKFRTKCAELRKQLSKSTKHYKRDKNDTKCDLTGWNVRCMKHRTSEVSVPILTPSPDHSTPWILTSSIPMPPPPLSYDTLSRESRRICLSLDDDLFLLCS